MLQKPASCDACPMREHGVGWVPPENVADSELLIVGEAPGEEEADSGRPFVGKSGQWLTELFKQARLDRKQACVVNTICCQPPKNVYPGDQKCTYLAADEAEAATSYCWQTHVLPFIRSRDWQRIWAFGNKALERTTGRSGIEKWRGSPLPLVGSYDRPRVVPTIHPSALMRTPALVSVVRGDIAKRPVVPPENYDLYAPAAALRQWKSPLFVFDFEWDHWGNVSLCGLSDRMYSAQVHSFEGEHIDRLKDVFESASDLVGHNIVGADTKYITRFSWDISKAKIWDTMLMQHLVQPDYKHGLAFVASVLTNKVFWKGKESDSGEEEGLEERGLNGMQWKTWDDPRAIPRSLGGYGGCRDGDEAFRLYNARDCDANMQAFYSLRTLLQRYQLERVYWNVSLPVAYVVRDVCQDGIKIDKGRLAEVRETLDKQIAEYDAKLPEGLRTYEKPITKRAEAPPNTYKIKVKRCKGTRKKAHPAVIVTFTDPNERAICRECGKELTPGKMSVAKYIKVAATKTVRPWASTQQVQSYATEQGLKEYKDRQSGNTTSGKKARAVWARTNEEFATLDKLKELSTLRTNFAKDGLALVDRMYYNLLVHGTGEGRLSSTARRRGTDIQIQNVPEEIKILFVPDHVGWSFLDLDIIQGENLLRAWFSHDWDRVERIQAGTLDEHSETATAMFGVTVTKSNENKHLRKAGKIANHAMGYGGGYKVIQEQLNLKADEIGRTFSTAEVKEMIANFKADPANALLIQWQDETIARAKCDSCLTNPFGRKRWFQTTSIATQALAFLPASTLADCVLRMMIAMFASHQWDSVKMWDVCDELQLSERFDWQEFAPWRMVTQVHDSIVSQGPTETLPQVAAAMARVMRQPWAELQGFRLGVDGKAGSKSLGELEKIKI